MEDYSINHNLSVDAYDFEQVDNCIFFECYLHPFSEVYDEIHIPLSISICIFGTVSNIFNIIVLTRNRMRTPINILLTGLSVSQWLLAANYLAFLVIEHYRMQCYPILWSEALTWYRFLNVNLNVVFHTIAFMTTIVVAVFRYCALKYPIQTNRYLYKSQLAILATIIVWIVVPIICAPVFLISEVKGIKDDGIMENCTFPGLIYDLNYQANPALVSAVFWMFGIVLKLIPSFVLIILLIALIRSLNNVERRRNKWTNPNAPKCTSSERKAKRKFASRSRTTRMLVIILLLCAVVELPNGILNLCMAIYGEQFGISIYDHLGSFMEMLTLLYSSVSFVLYCSMSNDFLTTFRLLFLPWVKTKDSFSNLLPGTASYFNVVPTMRKDVVLVARENGSDENSLSRHSPERHALL